MFLSGWKWKTKKIMIPSPFPAILRKEFIGLRDQGKYRQKKKKKERKKKIRLDHKPN